MVEDDHDKITSEEDEGEIQLEMSEVTLCTLDLRESEIYTSRHQKRRRRRRKKEERDIHSDGRPGVVCYLGSYFLEIQLCHSDDQTKVVSETPCTYLTEVSNREADGVEEHTLEVTRGQETTETSSRMNTDAQGKKHELLVLLSWLFSLTLTHL